MDMFWLYFILVDVKAIAYLFTIQIYNMYKDEWAITIMAECSLCRLWFFAEEAVVSSAARCMPDSDCVAAPSGLSERQCCLNSFVTLHHKNIRKSQASVIHLILIL